jgi:multiple sugar transport system permease protein
MRAVRSKRDLLALIFNYSFLTIVGLIVLLPFYWMIVSAIKPVAELITIPPMFFPSRVDWTAFERFMIEVPFFRVLSNSFIIAGAIMVISVIVATMTGYALAKYKARGANIVFILLLSSAMVPPFIKILPLYVGMVRIGLDDTLIGVIIPFYVTIFGIFFMRQYCLSIPDDLLMAARVEGASEPTILIWIVFPVVKQACAALAILKFLLEWNNFLWPLIMLSSSTKMTLQVAIAVLLDLETTWYYGIVLAGATLAVLPVVILFLILQRQIINSIALTGQKG